MPREYTLRRPTRNEKLADILRNLYEGVAEQPLGRISDALGITGFRGVADEFANPNMGMRRAEVPKKKWLSPADKVLDKAQGKRVPSDREPYVDEGTKRILKQVEEGAKRLKEEMNINEELFRMKLFEPKSKLRFERVPRPEPKPALSDRTPHISRREKVEADRVAAQEEINKIYEYDKILQRLKEKEKPRPELSDRKPYESPQRIDRENIEFSKLIKKTNESFEKRPVLSDRVAGPSYPTVDKMRERYYKLMDKEIEGKLTSDELLEAKELDKKLRELNWGEKTEYQTGLDAYRKDMRERIEKSKELGFDFMKPKLKDSPKPKLYDKAGKEVKKEPTDFNEAQFEREFENTINKINREMDPEIIRDNYNRYQEEYEWAKLHGTPDEIETFGTYRDHALDRLRKIGGKGWYEK